MNPNIDRMNSRNARHNQFLARREKSNATQWYPRVEEIPRQASAGGADYVFPNFLRSVQRHKGIILGSAAVCLLLAATITRFETPQYRAQVLMELRNPAAGLAPFRTPGGAMDPTSDALIQTNVTILDSAPLVKRVVERLHLDQLPGVSAGSDGTTLIRKLLRLPPLPDDSPTDQAVQNALENLNVRHTADVVEITYTSPDPVLAANFVNTLAEEHLRRGQEADTEALQRLSDRLTSETTGLRQQLQKSEGELRQYSAGTGLLSSSDRDDSPAEQRLRLLGEELSRAQADRILKESKREMAASAQPEYLSQTLDNPVLRDYQTKLTDLRQQAEQLQLLLTPENYKVEQVQREIGVLAAARDTELARMRKQLDTDYDAAVGREKMLQDRYTRESQQVADEAEKSVHYNTLKRELDTARTLQSEILEKGQQYNLAAATPGPGLRVVGRATPPAVPYRPNYALNLCVGLFAGLFAGALLAMLREHRRPTLRAPGDTLSLLRLPEFGAIPRAAGRVLNLPESALELGTRKPLAAPMVESIHDALASLSARCDGGPSVVVLTSPAPGDGKTTITVNLAIALAQSKRRVLLIDGDLRRPRLHKLFGVSMRPGLSDLLQDDPTGERPADPVVPNPMSIPNLHLLPSGPLTIPDAPLLSNGRLASLIARLRSEYDIVLVDTPPVLQSPDARLLGRLADGVILVVRSRKTTHQDAIAALARLMTDRIPVTGTILNGWNPRSDATAYHYQPYKAYAAGAGENA